jgi:hypothetical protein
MTLPNVLVIGAQKCGTTALYALLGRHPECAVGTVKESHFFVDEAPWSVGRWNLGLDWYSSLYPHDATVVADVCPSYAGTPVFPGVAERAASVLPKATIVYLVRDPIDRLISHWRHWIWRGYERRDFAESVLDPDAQNLYIACSSYAAQLRCWSEWFPPERIVVLHQDEVRAGAQRLFQLLGLAPLADSNVLANTSDSMRIERLTALPKALRHRLPLSVRSRAVGRPRVAESTVRKLWARLQTDTEAFEHATGVAVLGDAHRELLASA